MAYTKNSWAHDDYIEYEKLVHIEDGIADAAQTADSAAQAASAVVGNESDTAGTPTIYGVLASLSIIQEEGYDDTELRSMIEELRQMVTALQEIIDAGNSYALPNATTDTLGGVIIGDGLSVDENGTVSVDIDSIAATDETVKEVLDTYYT